LIETGISSTAEQIVGQIRSLGVDPSMVKSLFLTHAHADHITGTPLLKHMMPWLEIKTSAETQRLLAKEKIRKIFIRDDMEIGKRLKEMGVVANLAPEQPRLEGIVDKVVRPGQVLEWDTGPLEILDTPGHCKGGIALWHPETRMLFCSDCLGFHVPPDRFVPNFYVDYDDFMGTFEFLCGLKPEWICPGHCGAYRGEEAVRFMERSRAEMKWVHDYVVDTCGSPDRIETAKTALFDRYYVGEATMFSKESTRYCMDLLIRRILSSKSHASSQEAEKS